MGLRHEHGWSQTRHIEGLADGPSAERAAVIPVGSLTHEVNDRHRVNARAAGPPSRKMQNPLSG